MIDIILYIVLVMTAWDFSVHIIDWLGLDAKFKQSKSIFSYYYPHFSGKYPFASRELHTKRYNYFWITYWGTATILLIFYIVFK